MDDQKESVLALIRAIGELEEVSAIGAATRLAALGLDRRDIQKSMELGMRIVEGNYTRGEYFLADRLFADRLYARIMGLPFMRSRRPDDAPVGIVALGCIPGDMHDSGNEAAEAALLAGGFAVRRLGLGARAYAFAPASGDPGPLVVALHCARPGAAEEIAGFAGEVRRGIEPTGFLVVWGSDSLATGYKSLGADAWAEDVLALVDTCRAVAAEDRR